MWHLTVCKILVSLSFLNWIKMTWFFIVLSYLWIIVANTIHMKCQMIFFWKRKKNIKIKNESFSAVVVISVLG